MKCGDGVVLRIDPRIVGRRAQQQVFFFSSRRRHTRLTCDWSSDVCSSDLILLAVLQSGIHHVVFARYDDHPARLREVLAAEEARSTSHRLREQLGWMLAPL